MTGASLPSGTPDGAYGFCEATGSRHEIAHRELPSCKGWVEYLASPPSPTTEHPRCKHCSLLRGEHPVYDLTRRVLCASFIPPSPTTPAPGKWHCFGCAFATDSDEEARAHYSEEHRTYRHAFPPTTPAPRRSFRDLATATMTPESIERASAETARLVARSRPAAPQGGEPSKTRCFCGHDHQSVRSDGAWWPLNACSEQCGCTLFRLPRAPAVDSLAALPRYAMFSRDGGRTWTFDVTTTGQYVALADVEKVLASTENERRGAPETAPLTDDAELVSLFRDACEIWGAEMQDRHLKEVGELEEKILARLAGRPADAPGGETPELPNLTGCCRECGRGLEIHGPSNANDLTVILVSPLCTCNAGVNLWLAASLTEVKDG